jgi:hypothetical protein
MNVKVFNNPITILRNNLSLYRNHYYSKMGSVVKDYKRPKGSMKTFFGEGRLKTLDAYPQDYSLGLW